MISRWRSTPVLYNVASEDVPSRNTERGEDGGAGEPPHRVFSQNQGVRGGHGETGQSLKKKGLGEKGKKSSLGTGRKGKGKGRERNKRNKKSSRSRKEEFACAAQPTRRRSNFCSLFFLSLVPSLSYPLEDSWMATWGATLGKQEACRYPVQGVGVMKSTSECAGRNVHTRECQELPGRDRKRRRGVVRAETCKPKRHRLVATEDWRPRAAKDKEWWVRL